METRMHSVDKFVIKSLVVLQRRFLSGCYDFVFVSCTWPSTQPPNYSIIPIPVLIWAIEPSLFCLSWDGQVLTFIVSWLWQVQQLSNVCCCSIWTHTRLGTTRWDACILVPPKTSGVILSSASEPFAPQTLSSPHSARNSGDAFVPNHEHVLWFLCTASEWTSKGPYSFSPSSVTSRSVNTPFCSPDVLLRKYWVRFTCYGNPMKCSECIDPNKKLY